MNEKINENKYFIITMLKFIIWEIKLLKNERKRVLMFTHLRIYSFIQGCF